MSATSTAGEGFVAAPLGIARPPPYYGPHDALATGTDLAPLVWRGQILTVVTLGLYRFWYKTDLRRWYWRNTVIGGTTLEYRGSAKELFVGFLFALAIMVPLYLVSAYVGLFLGENVAAVAQALFGAAFVFLVQYGAFRSRRYRLTRTVWRGIRFDQTGSAAMFALKSMGWMVLTLLSAGILFPLMRRALERHRVVNTRFGSASGAFDVRVAPLMKRWLLLVVPMVVLLGGGGIQAALAADGLSGSNEQIAAVAVAILMVVLGVLWPLLLWPAYRAAEFRLFTSGTSIGPVRFASSFQTRRLYGLFGKVIGLSVVAAIAVLLVLAALVPAVFTAFSAGAPSFGMILIPVVLYLSGFTLFAVLKELVFKQGFWRHAVETLGIENLAAVDGIIGSSVSPESATGEGLADALDFGGV